MVLGVVWHFWMAPLLVGLALVAVVATVIGYLRKVEAPRHPRG
jgi:hypothetical protein